MSSFSSKSTEELSKITAKAIADVVREELDRHVRPITSGEYERQLFKEGFFENIEGFEVRELSLDTAWRTNEMSATYHRDVLGEKTRSSPVTTGKIRFTKSILLRDWEYLKNVVPEPMRSECKMTMPGIISIHMWLKPGTQYTKESGYTSDREYFEDLADVYRKEIRALYNAGLRDLQVDDPQLTYLLAEEFREGVRIDGEDPDELLDLYIWAHNLCLKDRPKDMHVGIHLCRGNFNTRHFASGSYDVIARKLFNDLSYDTFYLEYDTERAGSFEPLRLLPPGKNVVLGLISTKVPELEDADAMVARVYEAADSIAAGQGRTQEQVLREQVGVSPQCGFASFALADHFTMDRMWEKLELVRRVAKTIWPDEVE